MKDLVDSKVKTKSHSRRSSSSLQSTKSSRHHESKSRHRHSERKSLSHCGEKSSALHRLRKRVSHMIHEDRKHKRSSEPREEEQPTTCGCPNNCEAELQKLRNYVTSLLPLLPKKGDMSTLHQLDHFAATPETLLSEAWTTLGASHLRDIVSADLLAICARREEHDKKRSLSARDIKNKAVVHQSSPPFVSFEDEHSSVCTAGLRELWKRSLRELTELSVNEIKAILSGTSEESSKLHPNMSTQPYSQSDDSRHSPDALPTVQHKLPNSATASNTPSTSNLLQEKCPSPDSRNPGTVKRPELPVGSHCTINLEIGHEKPVASPSAGVSHSFDSGTESKGAGSASDTVAVRLQVQQEITELELRARAIRSMLKAAVHSNAS